MILPGGATAHNLAMDRTGTIAVVDDDAGVRSSLASLLRSFGHAVRCYDSALAFLSDRTSGEPDCLIADIQMPGMTGDRLQAALLAAGRRFPMVFMTAFPSEATRRNVLAAGALALLDKPADSRALCHHIDRALAGRGT